MKLEVQIGGAVRNVEIARVGNQLRCEIDGRRVDADIVEVARGVYSILIGGQSLEVRIEPRGARLRVHVGGREVPVEVFDPRQWRRRRGAALESEGRQPVVAPMPGKVIRVLVKAGEEVEAGQGLIVVEAMKMQNEVQAPKSGTIEKLLVAEGQAVNAGEILAVVA